jgi:hypothetical protein
MSNIANLRVFLERANALVKKSQPDLHDLSAVCESLATVMTDIIGAECRLVVKVDAKQLEKAIAIAEIAEKAGAQ